jgi:hypothetical protein
MTKENITIGIIVLIGIIFVMLFGLSQFGGPQCFSGVAC